MAPTRTKVLATAIRVLGRPLPRSRPGVTWLVVSKLATLASPADELRVEIAPGRSMWVQLSDPYWSRLLISKYRYEPELEDVLIALAPLTANFIDGGANFGYWTVLLSSPRFRIRHVVAVEASRSATSRLRRNLDDNGLETDVVERALSGSNGVRVSLEPGVNHSGTHVRQDGPLPADGAEESTTTITLDQLVQERSHLQDGELIVKLDIEGQEVPAFEGATTLLASPHVTFIYEDHGMDPECKVTDWMLSNTDRLVWLLSPSGLTRIESVAQLKLLKTHRAWGYNLLAALKTSRCAELISATKG